MNRRAVLAMLGAAALAGCVKPYADQGPANMRLNLLEAQGGFLTSRAVYLDVWYGPKGPDMVYLGTRKFGPGITEMGLPTGRPLHLALALEENMGLGQSVSTTTVEFPIRRISAGPRTSSIRATEFSGKRVSAAGLIVRFRTSSRVAR